MFCLIRMEYNGDTYKVLQLSVTKLLQCIIHKDWSVFPSNLMHIAWFMPWSKAERQLFLTILFHSYLFPQCGNIHQTLQQFCMSLYIYTASYGYTEGPAPWDPPSGGSCGYSFHWPNTKYEVWIISFYFIQYLHVMVQPPFFPFSSLSSSPPPLFHPPSISNSVWCRQ